MSGQWSNGATTAPAVTYSATGGSVNSSGLYTAGNTAGTFRVIAVQQGGTLADTSAITLTAAPPVLQAVILTPSSASLNTGATQQFAVNGQWSNGATTAPAVTYSATGGSVNSSGLYTAGNTAGSFRVIATQQGGSLADTSAITLTAAPPVLQAVILTPSSASLNTGATQQFAVNGQWSNGATTAPAVTYSATGGSVNSSGLYTAGNTAGTFRVIAMHQGGPWRIREHRSRVHSYRIGLRRRGCGLLPKSTGGRDARLRARFRGDSEWEQWGGWIQLAGGVRWEQLQHRGRWWRYVGGCQLPTHPVSKRTIERRCTSKPIGRHDGRREHASDPAVFFALVSRRGLELRESGGRDQVRFLRFW